MENISEDIREAAPILIGIVFLSAFGFAIQRVLMAPAQLSPTEEYYKAVRESVQPEASWVSRSLGKVDLSAPLTVVSWMTEDSVAKYRDGQAPYDTWATRASDMKSFCQEYVRSHGADADQLTLRLEQRLGLPPVPKYTRLVELTIDPGQFYSAKNDESGPKLFRPCADPSLDTDSCKLASDPSLQAPDPKKPDSLYRPPRESSEVDAALTIQSGLRAHQYWFLGKYYWSFASVPEHQYPWTSLGYTFDWAQKEDGSDDFVRRGEDEYVIQGGTKLKFVSSTPTLEYCTPH